MNDISLQREIMDNNKATSCWFHVSEPVAKPRIKQSPKPGEAPEEVQILTHVTCEGMTWRDLNFASTSDLITTQKHDNFGNTGRAKFSTLANTSKCLPIPTWNCRPHQNKINDGECGDTHCEMGQHIFGTTCDPDAFVRTHGIRRTNRHHITPPIDFLEPNVASHHMHTIRAMNPPKPAPGDATSVCAK
jgi:hypothetical protein